MNMAEVLRATGQAIATLVDDTRMPRRNREIMLEVLASAKLRDAQTRSAF